MKKICAIMIMAGVVLAMATAGGCDSNLIGLDRILLQSMVSAVLICTGGLLMRRVALA